MTTEKSESEILESVSSGTLTNSGIFNFEKFSLNLKKSITENITDDKDVELGCYLSAYEELYNFFLLLGGAFQFVASDVKNKIKILNDFREKEIQKSKVLSNFSTVKTMVNYEKEEKLFENPKYVTGSRTLLRLHRGLDFVRKFLYEVYNLDDDEKLGNYAREIYDQTLGKYHTWVVKNTARLAMKFLPTRKELLKKISQSDEENLGCILNMFPDALDSMNIVYDRVQLIYSDNCILDLP